MLSFPYDKQRNNRKKGTSKNPTRHAELVSASPLYQGIADHVRNDDCAKSVVFRSPQKHRIDV